MKRTKAIIGDRVNHSFLGDGTVEDIIVRGVLVLVRYDETPHVRYNMGENPTVSMLSDLKVLHDDLS